MNTNRRDRVNYQQRFDNYLSHYRRRSRFKNVAITISAIIFALMTISLFTAVFGDTLAYSNWLYYPARILVLITLVGLIVFLFWNPTKQLEHNDGATQIESSVPAFQGRAETYIDMKRRNIRSPFVGLLAKDAARKAMAAPVRSLLPASEIVGPVAAGTAMVVLTAWMFTSMPPQWRSGLHHLWLGWFQSDILPARSIAVLPGDTKIRLGDSLFIEATAEGFDSRLAELYIKRPNGNDGNPAAAKSKDEWEVVDMNRQPDGNFTFTLYGVSDPLEYYVSSAFTESDQFTVEVVVPAKIENIQLTYRFPEWTDREPVTVANGSDIAAVAGTQVDLAIRTDKPLTHGELLVNGVASDLTIDEQSNQLHYNATLTVGDENGEYQLADLLGDDRIMLTPLHTITVTEDAEPTIEFSRPGGDWNATAIEEVTVAAMAADDFSVEKVTLHYSVNGGEWTSKPLSAEEDYQHTFMLEEFSSEDGTPLLAGDLVTYYAEAADREQTVSTDIQFIDVRPFERRFTQSQQSSQGGGGGQQEPPPGEISQRQKEILVATFNLIKDQQKAEAAAGVVRSGSGSASGSGNGGISGLRSRGIGGPLRIRQTTAGDDLVSDSATLLSDLQNTLAEQAETLAKRAEARQLLNNDPKIAQFVDYMRKAAEAMRPSAEQLESQSLQEAVQHQKRALQFLRRGELLFNDITINQSQGGGGGGGNNAGRDMAEIYELEMDLAKNQYETPDSASSGGGSQDQSADDAFEKLKELAKRQQELARAAADKNELSSAERWEQEKLRRELEELKRELEQLEREQSASAENSQQSQGQQSQGQQGESQQSEGQQGDSDSQSQSDGQQGQGSSGGSQGESSASETRQAIQNLEDALREMDNANSNDSNATEQQQQQALQNASEKLQQSLDAIEEARKQRLNNQLSAASEAVRDLSRQQADTEQQLRDAMRRSMEARQNNRFDSGLTPQQQQDLAEQKREMQKQLEQVQQQMADAIKRFEEDAPETTQRLQQALDELDQNKAAELMGISGDMIEDGMAPQASLREPRITQALRNLQNDLSEAAEIASDEASQPEQQSITAADATRSLQQMRQALTEALNQSRNGQNGDQNGSQSSDQNGGQNRELQQLQGSRGEGSQEGGQQPGQEGQQGQQGQGQSSDGSATSWGPNRGSLSNSEVQINDGQQQLIEEATQQLESMANSSIEGLSNSTVDELSEIARRLQETAGDENQRRIDAEVRLLLRQLEQLELQVYSESQGLTGIRTGKPSTTPKGYDRRAADYFRLLSEGARSDKGS